MSLSWKAIRRGDVYCAPACGGRCKYAAYLKAKREAAALAKRLGAGWKPEVYENLGWHYVVSFAGLLTVRRERDGLFFAMLSSSREHPHSGWAWWTTNKRFASPEAAVLDAWTRAKDSVDYLARIIKDVAPGVPNVYPLRKRSR